MLFIFRTVVRLGILDFNPIVKGGTSSLDILIDSIIIHEGYSQDSKRINDIALLKLKDTVTFNGNFFFEILNHLQIVIMLSV